MKLTGYRLQHTIREASAELSVLVSQFEDSFMAFPDDKKSKPTDLYQKYLDLEEKITILQTTQGRYNLAVEVEVQGRKMTLAQAVKLVGGAGRGEKMWRGKARIKKERYSYSEDSRSKDHVYASRTMTPEECLAEAKKASKWAAALREAIQIGNAKEVDIEVDPALFE